MSDVDDETAPLGSLEDRAPAAPSALRQVTDHVEDPDEAPSAEDDVLRPLEPDEIRARRRPRALFFVWAWELACSLVIAVPVHTWARKVWGTHPDGDAVLFRPGGDALLSWLGDESPALSIVVRASLVAFFVAWLLGQVVTGMLLASLATGRGRLGLAPKTSSTFAVGAAAFLPFVGIGMIGLAAEGFVLGIGLLVSSSVDRSLLASLGDARSFMARLVVLSLFAFAAVIIGVVTDLVRAALARDLATGAPARANVALDAVGTAMRTARRALGRAVLGWSRRALLGIALLWVGAIAGDAVGGRGGVALWLLFAFHQLLLFLRVGLRASWLANALRLVLRRGGPL